MIGIGLNLGGGGSRRASPATGSPANTVAPVVTSNANLAAPAPGDILQSTRGTWTGGGLHFAYQWRYGSDDSAAVGAGNDTPVYVVDASDDGGTLYCEVTATNTLGSTSHSSNESGTVAAPVAAPVNLSAPVATSNADIDAPVTGDTLSSSAGSWSGSPGYSYQWKLGSDDSNATGTGAATATYTVNAADVGDTLYCHVTATNAGGSASADSNGSGVVTAAPSSTGTPVDLLLRFEDGTAGDLITAAQLNSGQIGSGWTWTQSRTPLEHTKTVASNYTLRAPVAVAGTDYDGSGTRALKFDLTAAVSNNSSPIYETLTGTPDGSHNDLVLSATLQFATTGSESCDIFNISGSSYVTLQWNNPPSGGDGGTAGELHIETQVSGVTYKSTPIPIDAGQPYRCHLFFDGTNHLVSLIVINDTTGALVGTSGKAGSDVAGPVVYVLINDYLTFNGGSITIDNFCLSTGSNAVTPREAFTTPDPTSVAAVQTVASTVVLTWNATALAYKIERNAGSGWSTLQAGIFTTDLSNTGGPGENIYSDTGLTDATTYTYRVTSIIGTHLSSAVSSGSVTIDNSSSPVAVDNFDSYNDGYLGLGDSASNWEAIADFVNLTGTGAVAGATQAMAKSKATFNANHRSECTLLNLSPGSFHFGSVGVRCQTGVDSRYWFQTDGTNWYLVKRNAGSQVVITNGTHSITSGAKIALTATGTGSATRLTAQVNTSGSWVNVTGAVSQDPGGTYLDGGAPGVGGDSASSNGQCDDWKGFNA